MVKKYQYEGPIRVIVPLLGRQVEPGEIVETDRELNHPHFVLIKPKPSKETADADN